MEGNLEVEEQALNDETLRFPKSDWYRLFVIPILNEAEKRKINKSKLFIYLAFVENLAIEDISRLFRVSRYYIVMELIYFLVQDCTPSKCIHSRTSDLVSITILNQKVDPKEASNLDLHLRTCSECQNTQRNILKNMFEYKKSVADSLDEFIHRTKPDYKKTGLLVF